MKYLVYKITNDINDRIYRCRNIIKSPLNGEWMFEYIQ